MFARRSPKARTGKTGPCCALLRGHIPTTRNPSSRAESNNVTFGEAPLRRDQARVGETARTWCASGRGRGELCAHAAVNPTGRCRRALIGWAELPRLSSPSLPPFLPHPPNRRSPSSPLPRRPAPAAQLFVPCDGNSRR